MCTLWAALHRNNNYNEVHQKWIHKQYCLKLKFVSRNWLCHGLAFNWCHDWHLANNGQNIGIKQVFLKNEKWLLSIRKSKPKRDIILKKKEDCDGDHLENCGRDSRHQAYSLLLWRSFYIVVGLALVAAVIPSPQLHVNKTYRTNFICAMHHQNIHVYCTQCMHKLYRAALHMQCIHANIEI